MHLKILFFHPLARRYPKARDRAWLMREAEIDRSLVFFWRHAIERGLMPKRDDRLEILGKVTPSLVKLGRLTKRFLQFTKTKAIVAIGTQEKARFERFPRRRIVLGEPSLLQALHEVAHARFGASEAIAVAWSCRMFVEIYPEARTKGKWCRHVVINEHEFLRL